MYFYVGKIYAPVDRITFELGGLRQMMHICKMMLATWEAAQTIRIIEIFDEDEFRFVPFKDGVSVNPKRGVSLKIDYEGQAQIYFQYYWREVSPYGSIAELSLADDDVKSSSNSEGLFKEFIQICMLFTPPEGFAWIDHELVLDHIEPNLVYETVSEKDKSYLTFPKINALAWANIFPRETYSNLPAETKKLIDNAPWHLMLDKKQETPDFTAFLTNKDPTLDPSGDEFLISQHFGGISVRGIEAPKLGPASQVAVNEDRDKDFSAHPIRANPKFQPKAAGMVTAVPTYFSRYARGIFDFLPHLQANLLITGFVAGLLMVWSENVFVISSGTLTMFAVLIVGVKSRWFQNPDRLPAFLQTIAVMIYFIVGLSTLFSLLTGSLLSFVVLIACMFAGGLIGYLRK